MAEEAASRAGPHTAFGLYVLGLNVVAIAFAFPALIGFAIAGITRRGAAPLAGVLTCVFMMFGGWKLLRMLPGFSAVRLAGTWPLLVQYFIAWLIAYGADRFSSSAGTERVSLLGRVFVGGFGLLWAVMSLISGLLPDWLESNAALRFFPLPFGSRSLLLSGLSTAGGLLIAF